MDAETSHPEPPRRALGVPGPGTKLLGRYELIDVLGRGGRGIVYRAEDQVLGREVACKLVPSGGDDAGVEARFQREALMVARLDHPNIVPVYDFGRHEGTLFYVMPLLAGGSLRRRVAHGELSLGAVVELAAQVASALDYSHAHGVVHRDVKPENILFVHDVGDVRVRVTDFGLAHDRDSSRLTKTNHLPGTLAYLSPEQVAGTEIDGRADLYALGVVLYEILSGGPPFAGAPFSVLYRIVHEAPEPLGQRLPDLDLELVELIDRCLSKDRDQRPASGREVERILQGIHSRLDAGARARTLDPVARPGPAPRETPLVGREAETAALRGHLDAAAGGECHLVLVAGEAGTGKTRLLQELEGWALVRGVRVLRGHFSADDRTFPYQGLCELIQDHFRIVRSSSSQISGLRAPFAADREDRFDVERPAAASDLADLAHELITLFPQLMEVPELRDVAKDAPPRALRAEVAAPAGPTRIYELLARTLARLGAGKPQVLLLESLHLGEVAVEALRYLVPRLAATPTLIVATYRPAEVGKVHPLAELIRQFADDPRFGVVEVGNLGRGEFSTLVTRLVGSDALADPVVARLYEATDGNPLFAHELVASLRESGELTRDPSGLWRLTGDIGALTHALPATLHQAAEARLARLDADDRTVLTAASVVGRSFDLEDLRAVLREVDRGLADEDSGVRSELLDERIDRLVALGLLSEDLASRGDRLGFTSTAVRDLLYRELSRRRRRALHRACARHLETRHQNRLARALPQLVHHFSRADCAPETVRYALQLARRSLDAYSPDDALHAARTALELVDDESVPARERTEAELLYIIGRAQRALGDLDGALRRCEEASGLFAASGDIESAAAVALFVAEAAWQGRKVDDARAWADRGADLARQIGDAQVLHRLLTLGGTLANLRGETARARAYLEEAEELEAGEATQVRETFVPRGGTLRVAMTHPVERLVPGDLETDEEAEVATNVFETLLVAEEDGRLRPGLCKEWRGVGDLRTFVLHLDPEARFSDGTQVTAEAVRRSLERSARAGAGSLAPGFFQVIEGMAEMLAGDADEARGLHPVDERTLEVRLVQPLPLFPVLLSDSRTAITKEVAYDAESLRYLGTGPFVLAAHSQAKVRLERAESYWRDEGARLDALEFHTGYRSSEIAAALRAGEFDLGRDLVPEDLEDLLRDPRWRSGLVEATRKNVYFALLHPAGPVTGSAGVRRALLGILWAQDLVWRTLGRFAHPAVGLLPPGVLGHDPGRRAERMLRARARILLEESDQPFPLRLRAAVHPVLQDRYAGLLEALFREWRSLGVEVEVATEGMAELIATYREPAGFDLLLGRWNADYDDPDNFTYNIFHSAAGIFRAWMGEGAQVREADEILERARREADPAVRMALYRRFTQGLEARNLVLPLFHDVDYRLAAPRVRGLTLGTSYPYVGYARVGVVPGETREAGAQVVEAGRQAGSLQVPVSVDLESLDPADATSVERLEVVSNVFETLTRLDRSVRIVPWLASTLESEDGGRRYVFRLRPGLRFHDGRPCTARDVRHSFERLLRSPQRDAHFPLLPVRGALALREGETDRLAGLEIRSTHEMVLELETPLSYFPALLAHPLAAIVPENASTFTGRWRDGTAGTGPFRVVGFEPGARVELERNPYYWRRGLPKAERLVFHLGMEPETIVSEFEAGRLSVASDLLPDDVGLLCERRPAPRYREHPRLSTHFLCLDNRRGPFVDPELRHAFARALDLGPMLAATLGSRVSRAHGLLPPGMLGYDARRRLPARDPAAAERLRGLRLAARPFRSYLGSVGPFWRRWCEEMRRLGVELTEASGEGMGRLEVDEGRVDDSGADEMDVVAVRWTADYPDADAFTLALEFCAARKVFDLDQVPEIGRLARQGRYETDPSLRHALYRELEDVLARECLIVPLFHEQGYRLGQPNVRGLRLQMTFPEVCYEELSLEG